MSRYVQGRHIPGASALVAGVAVTTVLSALAFAGDRQLGTIGPPPRATPQRETAAESMPPLPLPATPLRRSEPKAEPAPPLFIGKVKYGSTQDYMPNPGDVDNLLRYVRSKLDAWYGQRVLGLDELVALQKANQPCQIPMLYMTGYEKFELAADEREALKQYLLDGGTLVADAALGSPAFVESFRHELSVIFPDRKLDVLQLDHPVLRGYYNYSNVHYFTISQGNHVKMEGPPQLLGMNIAARTAVILSPYDMTCGWDEFYAPAAPRRGSAKPEPTMAMVPEDAIRMGINIVAYVSAQHRFAKSQAQTREIVGQQAQQRAALPIAQLRHQGDWNPDPNSLQQLVRNAAQQTSIPMKFEVKPVDADVRELIDTPIVIMTGMDDPRLSDTQVDALHRHVQAGGFLFINNTSGFALFDREARALIARILPDQKLQAVPREHPIFKSLFDLSQAEATDKVKPVELEAVLLDGRAAVVYSKNDTLAMLKGIHDPYANVYEPDVARKLSLNILAYALQK